MLVSEDEFRGKTALVTGGGTGIGRASAVDMLRGGAHVIIVGRRASVIDQAVQELSNYGEVEGGVCDVRDAAAVESLVRSIVRNFGHLDLVFNNAGGQFPTSTEDISDNGWNAILNTNLTGTFNVCRHVLKENLSVAGVRILNMTLPWVFRGCTGLTPALAARAGVVGLTRSLAIEFASRGATINAIAPGLVLTDGMVLEELGGRAGRAEGLMEAIPLGRCATAEEVSRVVVSLLSETFSYMTGQTVILDGGSVLGRGIDYLTVNANGGT